MICGNDSAKEVLKGYFKKIRESGRIPYSFLLLEGQSNIGKTSLIRGLSKEFLGSHFDTDFLFIPDLSEYLDGKHTIKIDVDEKDQIIDIPGEGSFVDYGARQIISWLSRSSIGKYKILLLENIERMTISAANAFLKTFEETAENTIIFATTTNKNLVLETILSRAFFVKFQIPTQDIVISCLKQQYSDVSEDRLQIIASFSMNRIGFAKKLIEHKDNVKGFDEILNYYQRFINLFHIKSDYLEKYNILVNVNKSGLLKIFLEALMFYYANQKDMDSVDKILKVIGRLESNVGVDNLLFEMIL